MHNCDADKPKSSISKIFYYIAVLLKALSVSVLKPMLHQKLEEVIARQKGNWLGSSFDYLSFSLPLSIAYVFIRLVLLALPVLASRLNHRKAGKLLHVNENLKLSICTLNLSLWLAAITQLKVCCFHFLLLLPQIVDQKKIDRLWHHDFLANVFWFFISYFFHTAKKQENEERVGERERIREEEWGNVWVGLIIWPSKKQRWLFKIGKNGF